MTAIVTTSHPWAGRPFRAGASTGSHLLQLRDPGDRLACNVSRAHNLAIPNTGAQSRLLERLPLAEGHQGPLVQVAPLPPDAFKRVDVEVVLWEVSANLGDRPACDRATAAIVRETADERLRRDLAYLGATAYLDGRLHDYQRIIDERVDVMRSARHPDAFVWWYVSTLALLRERGTVAELPTLLEDWENTPRPAVPSTVVQAFTALTAVLTGDHESVALENCDPEHFADDGGRSAVLAATAEVAAAVGDDQLVRQMLRSVEGFDGMHLASRAVYWGPYDRIVALLCDRLGDHHEADEAFERGSQACRAFRTPVWVARAELDWGESLYRRGMHDAAALHVQAARVAIGDLPLNESRYRADQLDARLA